MPSTSQLVGMAIASALAVFGARTISNMVGGAGTVKGLAAEIAGGMLGIYVAAKLKV